MDTTTNPTPKPSLVPRVFGILSIIFASMVFTMASLKALSTATYTPQLEGAVYANNFGDGKAAQTAIVAFHEATRMPKAIIAATLVFMSMALFVIGLGQLRYRPWSRGWTLGWALGGLTILFAIAWIELGWVQGASTQLQLALSKAAEGGGQHARTMAMVASLMTGSPVLSLAKLVLYLPYPILLIAYFTRPRVRDALNALPA